MEVVYEFVNRLLNEYTTVKTETFGKHPFGVFIRKTIPENMYSLAFMDQNQYLIKGSVGQGNWATIPWLCIFNRSVTTTATEGVYIVYLLSEDCQSLYLTLNQGCTKLRGDHTKVETMAIMQSNAKEIAARINSRGFSTGSDIHLGSGITELGEMYQAGTIFYKEYKRGVVPAEAELEEDLQNMMAIYEEYVHQLSNPSNKAWLFPWDPTTDKWEDYKQGCRDTKFGKKQIRSYASAGDHPVVGDEIYYIKIGTAPTGIFAHGKVVEVTQEVSDLKKRAAKLISVRIVVAYDRLQDYDSEPLLSDADLNSKLPKQKWNPFKTGVEILPDVLPELRKLWDALIQEEDAYWPSQEEYPISLTKEDWKKFLDEIELPSHSGCMRVLKCFLDIGGIASCKELAKQYGGTPAAYNASVMNTCRRAMEYFHLTPCPDGEANRVFPIAFQGKGNPVSGNYVYKMRSALRDALSEMDLRNINLNKGGEDKVKQQFDKNMILYGPPGTGKTYHTAIYAVAICDDKSLEELTDYDAVLERYKELKQEQRIAFTTFHQSYGYEEFIEGIKPVVNEDAASLEYTVEAGVFKKFCERAEMPEQETTPLTGMVWNVRSRAGDKDVPFDYDHFLYSEGVVVVEDIEDQKRQCNFLTNMKPGDLVVLGRNYTINAVGIVMDTTPESIDKHPFHWQRKVKWLATNLSVTFSDIAMPGACFSNFAVAKSKIKPQNLANIIPHEADTKPFVFIIDEINRGNIAKIFGELITLIENTKRKGMKEAASAILPYSGTEFSVPSNVYIIGTMNTADRSIAVMDTALRRRFQFVEMMPDANVLRKIGADHVDDLDVAAMLEKINERITFLYDREHTIGHAFFTKLAEDPTVTTLQSIFEKSVLPLLQEYFYEDYQKIQLVLGDNGKTDSSTKFIVDEDVKVKSIFKGDAEDVVDLPEKKYSINSSAFGNLESYKQIL